MTRGKAFGWFMLGYVTANLLAAGIDLFADWYEKKEGEEGIALARQDAAMRKLNENAAYGKGGVTHMDVVSPYPKDISDVIRENIQREADARVPYTGDYPTREDYSEFKGYPSTEDLDPLSADRDAQQDAAYEAARDNAERNMDK